jgi:hypothetical protein
MTISLTLMGTGWPRICEAMVSCTKNETDSDVKPPLRTAKRANNTHAIGDTK